MDRKRNSSPTGKINRRHFLSTSAAASFAFTILPRHVLGGAGNTPPSEKLNIGVVGNRNQGGGDLKQ